MTLICDTFAATGPHETQIRSLFPSSFHGSHHAPIFNKPLFILAFTNRSGSNLLADYLRQTGRFRGFGEGLNGDEVKRSHARSPVASFPDYIAQLAGPLNEPGFWGIKASWDQIILLHRANIPAMFSGVRIIHSVRRDLLGQAVSHWIAHQTKQWTSAHQQSGVTPKFDRPRIEQILMSNLRSNCHIDLISRALGIQRHVVIYEEIQDNPEREIKRLGKAMSIDLDDWQPRAPRIKRQRDHVNDSFRAECLDAWRSVILP